MELNEYAKTDSTGAVIEYPVYEHHIKNRGHLTRSYERVSPVPQPEFDKLLQVIAKRRIPVRIDGVLHQAWSVSDKPEPMLRADMITELASIRYDHEIGGITLPGGVVINTNRDDQGMTDRAFSSLSNGLIPSTRWKGPGGWVTVTLAELTPIAKAVAQHVSACFASEGAVVEKMESLTFPQLQAFNLKNEFSQAYAESMAELLAE